MGHDRQDDDSGFAEDLISTAGVIYAKIAWLHGFMASWLHGFMASWLHGFMASWLHGFMASWLHGFMALKLRLNTHMFQWNVFL
jgi:ABC-type uncharacterized transport system permease subunit